MKTLDVRGAKAAIAGKTILGYRRAGENHLARASSAKIGNKPVDPPRTPSLKAR